jgi:hypothetical protein
LDSTLCDLVGKFVVAIPESVKASIDSWERGERDIAVLHACLATDGTAKKTPGLGKGNRRRFTEFLRCRYWLLEPTAMPGVNLVETRFTNVPLRENPAPDYADVIYEVFRCAHAHGDEVRPGFELTMGVGDPVSQFVLSDGHLHMPDTVVFGLLAASVLAPVNAGQTIAGDYFLSLGHLELNNYMQFPINDWWGCEDVFRPIAEKHNKIRVTLNW